MKFRIKPYPAIALIVLSSLCFSCTPSPRYRGSTRKRADKPQEQAAATYEDPVVKDLDITLRNPLGGTGGGKINSLFGIRTHPSYGTQEFHSGVDLEADTGDAVYAAADGKVTYSGNQKGYGKVIIIDHGRDISTVYAHLAETAVRKGADVRAGQRIGKVGVSGNATGSHLHFELRKSGKAVDPLDYMEIR